MGLPPSLSRMTRMTPAGTRALRIAWLVTSYERLRGYAYRPYGQLRRALLFCLPRNLIKRSSALTLRPQPAFQDLSTSTCVLTSETASSSSSIAIAKALVQFSATIWVWESLCRSLRSCPPLCERVVHPRTLTGERSMSTACRTKKTGAIRCHLRTPSGLLLWLWLLVASWVTGRESSRK